MSSMVASPEDTFLQHMFAVAAVTTFWSRMYVFKTVARGSRPAKDHK